ncbi:hypothetical protein [Pseudoalteromonas umbrosa]|uniref:hypothetical protein n=1 Tax=Pseudoalteromonas umbrosa TaxID=3048489 RepID=UPI0024C396C0|nr:hypothetical protein [Pseudoalteromonas sp. B95]MDK1290157.1 hypothetical protein [Pseudoalteromonas sp. B95]
MHFETRISKLLNKLDTSDLFELFAIHEMASFSSNAKSDRELFSFAGLGKELKGDWSINVWHSGSAKKVRLKLMKMDQISSRSKSGSYYTAYMDGGQVHIEKIGRPDKVSRKALKALAAIFYYNQDLLSDFAKGTTNLRRKELSAALYKGVKGKSVKSYKSV